MHYGSERPSAPLSTQFTRRQLFLGAFGLAAATTLVGCGIGEGSAIDVTEDTELSVGVIPVADFAPVYVAAEQGFFAAEGLKVRTQVMQNAAAIAPSVINGQLTFGTAAVPPFLAASAKGLPLLAVANGTSIAPEADKDPSALVATKASGATRPKDLEGRTVAVNALTSIVHVAAAAAIKNDGGDPSKVNFVAMPFPDMVPALARNAIDAACLVEPFQVQAVNGGATVLEHPYSKVFYPNGSFTVIFTAGPFAEKNPDVVAAFQRAVDKGSELAAEDPKVVGQVLQKYGKLPPEVFEKMRLPMFSTELSEPALAHASELMHSLGFLPEQPSIEEAVWKP
ncbi:ABC transporter substrate-binding protein [Micrococcoides hystricis]|uniref:ABC transporter substrate-binding protein n=1 Tax=Micrococcoides hystricis TaxID=1572761 RepID=A0ABV6PAQ3_9MICC